MDKTQKNLNDVILKHPVLGGLVAFSSMFSLCYLINILTMSLFSIGTNDLVVILIPSVAFTVAFITASKKNK